MTTDFYINKSGGIHGNLLPTGLGRASFLNLETPNTKYSPPKFGLSIAFPPEFEEKNKPQVEAIKEMCREMAKLYVATHIGKYRKTLKNPKLTEDELMKIKVNHWNMKQPIFRDGDATDVKEFAGCQYIVAKNAKIEDVTLLGVDSVSDFKAGQIVRAMVVPYLGEDGFAYKLTSLKLVKDDGVRYSAAPTGASMLDKLDEAVAAVEASNTVAGDVTSMDVL